MSNTSLAELYFIAGMMLVILIGCTAAVYFFFKTFYKEKRESQQNPEKPADPQNE